MNVQYYGLGCFRLQTPSLNILINPFDSKAGLSAPKGQSDVCILTETGEEKPGNAEYVIDRPGEYDVKGFSVVGLPNKTDEGYKTVYWMELNGIRSVYVGGVKEWNVDMDDVAKLGRIDCLFIPVGGGSVMDFSRAAKLSRELDVRLVIPSYFSLPGLKVELDPVDKFLKEMGSKSEPCDKYKVVAKELPEEGVSVVYIVP